MIKSIVFLNLIKIFLITLGQDIQALMPSCSDIHCNCPKCKAKSNFSYHGSYNRNISFIRDNNVFDFKVSVTRVICNSCGSTHALLPNFIVPYKIFSRESFLYAISQACATSVITIAEKLGLSFQLIYSFLALILSFFPFADSLNRQEIYCQNFNHNYFTLNCLTFCNTSFDISFFKRYIWIFLMTKFQNMEAPPVSIGINF